MRIRKRFLLYSLSSLPLSDPQLNRSSSLVQQQHQEGCNTISQPSDSPNQPPPPPSDQNVTRWVFSGRRKELDGEEEEKSNDIKKGSISGAEVNSGFLQKTASSHQEDGRWTEGDKVVPPKKRRGSFERRDSDEAEKEKKMKAKMKSKTNKKCIQLPNGDDEEETKEGNIIGDSNISLKKKKKKVKRGNVIMEGSRCSRVNGRGWRCCQQTLVGYSLCEHHLGKGRVRSMSSVRNRAMANTTRAPKKDGLGLLSTSAAGKLGQRLFEEEDDEEDDDDDDYEEEEEEEKLLMMTKKRRRKIGMVKARSISSLLGQTNSAVVIVNDHKTETAAAVDGDK